MVDKYFVLCEGIVVPVQEIRSIAFNSENKTTGVSESIENPSGSLLHTGPATVKLLEPTHWLCQPQIIYLYDQKVYVKDQCIPNPQKNLKKASLDVEHQVSRRVSVGDRKQVFQTRELADWQTLNHFIQSLFNLPV